MSQGKLRFDGQAIVVTGAGRGIGRNYAMLLASSGAKVVVADSGVGLGGEDATTEPADSVVAEINAGGGEAVACTADLSTETGASEAVEASLKSFNRIDGILHNASPSPLRTTIDKLTTQDFDLVMRVNLFAGFWMTRVAWPHMVNQGYGRILFTTSGVVVGNEGNAPYASAKAACISMMRCFALEGAKHGILVNAIAPSARSRMTERTNPSPYKDWLLKTMLPEKVAVGAAFLMSKACDIYGEILAIGGGHVARMTLAENEGYFGAGASVEEMSEAIPRVLTDTRFFYPKDLSERSVKVADLFGFGGGADAQKTFAIKPAGNDGT